MKIKTTHLVWVLALLALSTLNPQLSTCLAQGTAFTYQGRLNSNGTPAGGTYDFRFRLAADPLGNTYVGSPYLTNGIAVSGGLFTTTMDFGPGLFAGSNYWLEVDVRTNGTVSYTGLTPLQALTPTPYAIFAGSSSNLLGALPAGQLSGTILNSSLPASPSFSGTVTAGALAGNGANVTNVNAASLNGLNATNFWQLGGNNVAAGQFLGSTNNQPVALYVGNQQAFLITTNPADSANFIGGSPANVIDAGVEGAVIAGGGTTNYSGSASANHISANFASIGGGSGNWIQSGSDHAFIGAGWNNLIAISSHQSVIAGGENNANASLLSVIGGGGGNTIQGSAFSSFLGGGDQNTIQSGANNSFLGGGIYNSVHGPGAFIGGGGGIGIVLGNLYYYPSAGNTANGVDATIGGGGNNAASGDGAFIGGGGLNAGGVLAAYPDAIDGNTASGQDSSIVGGAGNVASGTYSSIGGGHGNVASGLGATVGGGENNSTTVSYATIPGGYKNLASGTYSFAAGDQAQATNQGAFVWADSQGTPFASTANNQFLIRAQGGVGINTATTPDSSFSINTNVYLFSHTLYLRGETASDHNHGLAYNGNTITNFGTGNYQLDGPVLWGFSGGLLGTRNGGDHAALTWNTTGVAITGTLTGNGSGLTNLSAAQLSGSVPSGVPVPAANLTGALPAISGANLTSLPANAALLNANQTFTGGNTFTSTTTVTNAGGANALNVYSTQTGGWASPVSLFENKSTAATASPALRVVCDGGTNVDGALSVSVATGTTGLIAEFGNSTAFVVRITNNGSIFAQGNVYANGVLLTSDRNAKEHFQPVDHQAVLAKVASLPVTQWNYTQDQADVQHIGPMAQDFQAAFGLDGGDDKHISVVDEGGVALAAIQGLNEKFEGSSQKEEGQIAELKAENAELKAQLAEIKTLLQQIKAASSK